MRDTMFKCLYEAIVLEASLYKWCSRIGRSYQEYHGWDTLRHVFIEDLAVKGAEYSLKTL